MAASLGKMPTTSVRGLISPLRRSSGLVLWALGSASRASSYTTAWNVTARQAWRRVASHLLPKKSVEMRRDPKTYRPPPASSGQVGFQPRRSS